MGYIAVLVQQRTQLKLHQERNPIFGKVNYSHMETGPVLQRIHDQLFGVYIRTGTLNTQDPSQLPRLHWEWTLDRKRFDSSHILQLLRIEPAEFRPFFVREHDTGTMARRCNESWLFEWVEVHGAIERKRRSRYKGELCLLRQATGNGGGARAQAVSRYRRSSIVAAFHFLKRSSFTSRIGIPFQRTRSGDIDRRGNGPRCRENGTRVVVTKLCTRTSDRRYHSAVHAPLNWRRWR